MNDTNLPRMRPRKCILIIDGIKAHILTKRAFFERLFQCHSP